MPIHSFTICRQLLIHLNLPTGPVASLGLGLYFHARFRANVTHISRTLSAPAFLLPKTVFVLKHFEKLQDLIIDCSHCTLSSQIATLSRLFDALSDKHNLVPNLRALIMTNVPRLDESLLNTIAGSLRQVVNLHVSTIEGIEMDCCRNCYEESLIRVLHSPIQNYHDGKDMAVSPLFLLDNVLSIVIIEKICRRSERLSRLEKSSSRHPPFTLRSSGHT